MFHKVSPGFAQVISFSLFKVSKVFMFYILRFLYCSVYSIKITGDFACEKLLSWVGSVRGF